MLYRIAVLLLLLAEVAFADVTYQGVKDALKPGGLGRIEATQTDDIGVAWRVVEPTRIDFDTVQTKDGKSVLYFAAPPKAGTEVVAEAMLTFWAEKRHEFKRFILVVDSSSPIVPDDPDVVDPPKPDPPKPEPPRPPEDIDAFPADLDQSHPSAFGLGPRLRFMAEKSGLTKSQRDTLAAAFERAANKAGSVANPLPAIVDSLRSDLLSQSLNPKMLATYGRLMDAKWDLWNGENETVSNTLLLHSMAWREIAEWLRK